jgi:eukaryotic-like serine/threonine-protein kinase
VKCPRCESENPETSLFCAGCGTRLTALPGALDEERTRTLAPVPDLETGAIFADRYQVIEKIGAGGMGRVYKVYDTKVKEKIALKIIKPEIASDEKTIERFGQELRAARRIAHRNVCRMFDLGEHAGTHYITMEYVPGETLKNVIRMTGPLSVGVAVDYARQIADGLEEARRWGIVHRDLKPQNVLIDPTGTARIMDFGIARSVQARELTAEGVVIGTPEYMSPEQAEGQEVDHRSDLYSLGMILYEMVTGKSPFESRTPLGVLVKQKIELPRPPRQLNPQVPESVEVLILKCLAKDRNQRYQTAAEVRDALEKIESSWKPTAAHPETPRGTKRRLWSPVLKIAAGALILSAAAGGLYVLVKARRAVPVSAVKTETSVAAPSVWTNSVAVIPFEVKGSGPTPSGLGYDLAAGIRQKLKSFGYLEVAEEYASDQYRTLAGTPVELGKALHADNILVGTVEMTPDGISVNIRLTNTTQGEPFVFKPPYKNKREGPFLKMEEQIANDVAAKLLMTPAAAYEGARFSVEPADPDVRALMAKAKKAEFRYRDMSHKDDFEEAVLLYRKVIERDRDYPLSYWGLGNLYESRYATSGGDLDDFSEMRLNYESAFKKNDKIAETRAGMGWVYYYESDWDKAYVSFKSAYDLAPNNAEINFNVGSFFRSIGLDHKAIWYYTRALTIDPGFHYAHRNCAASYWNLGQFEMGLRSIEEGLKTGPANFLLHTTYARFLVATRNLDKAETELQGLEKDAKTDADRERLDRLRIWFLALKGDTAKARELLKNIKQRFRYEITNALITLGDKDLAIENINWGIEGAYYLIKDFLYPYPYFKNNPFFEGLGSDPRFQKIEAKAKAVYEEKDHKYIGF